MMKNTLKLLYLAAFVGTVLFGTTSCNNDEFLSVDHYGILPADQMFKSEVDAAKGLVGVTTCSSLAIMQTTGTINLSYL
jgi:hypothetical protein